MTVTDFITNHVRSQISDKVSDYRWDNPALLIYVNEGRKNLKGIHPEAFYVSGIVTGEPADLAIGATLDITACYILSLASYVCFRVLGENSEDASNRELSAYHYKLYMQR
jgi:hypothetical protein